MDSLVAIPKPTHIYQVVSSSMTSSELSFRKHAIERQVLFGFHGTSLDCFHSILSYGLQQHLCKVCACHYESNTYDCLICSPIGFISYYEYLVHMSRMPYSVREFICLPSYTLAKCSAQSVVHGSILVSVIVYRA